MKRPSEIAAVSFKHESLFEPSASSGVTVWTAVRVKAAILSDTISNQSPPV
jgi:hypothetical protein